MEGVTPVTPDLEALEAICRTGSQRIAHVAQVQEELLLAQEQHELVEEQEQYAQVSGAAAGSRGSRGAAGSSGR